MGRCGSVVVRERDKDTKGSEFDLGKLFSFFLIYRNPLDNTQKFSKCLKKGSDLLRKGKLRRPSQKRVYNHVSRSAQDPYDRGGVNVFS